MIIAIDTREQKPFEFKTVRPRQTVIPVTAVVQTLTVGDYALMVDASSAPIASDRADALIDRRIVGERKSLADLYSSATHNRDRFERELERMSDYAYRFIVIEADWLAIMDPNSVLAHPTKASPRSIASSLLAWSRRYGVHVFPCPNRDFAEQLTFRLLEGAWMEKSPAHRAEQETAAATAAAFGVEHYPVEGL
jgi:ERCC4-type nuclease